MKKKYANLVLLALALILLLGLPGCNETEREYYPDIVITLQDQTESIIIKEWNYLQGSCAEVYYQNDDAAPVLLGTTTGGDDGFCPFKEGLYEIAQDGHSVTVKWCFNPSDNDKSNWKTKTFELPE